MTVVAADSAGDRMKLLGGGEGAQTLQPCRLQRPEMIFEGSGDQVSPKGRGGQRTKPRSKNLSQSR